MSKKNALTELNYLSKEKQRSSTQTKAKSGYKNALRNSALFIRNTAIVIATLFILTVAVTAVLVFTPDEKNEVLTPDFALTLDKTKDSAKIEYKPTVKEPQRYNVKFTFYKKDDIVCTTTERTLGELIEALNISLDDNELMNADLNAKINKDTVFNIDNVSYDTVKVDEIIDYETEYVDVESIPKHTTQVHQNGIEGTHTYEYKVTYVNGVEKDRELVNDYVSKNPTPRIIYRGVGGMVNIGGKYYDYTQVLTCRSTVYTDSGITASGIPTSEDVISVDPTVIPLGSRVYIEGIGFRTAADTGSLIKGNIIDIYYDINNSAWRGYDNRTVKVYILG